MNMNRYYGVRNPHARYRPGVDPVATGCRLIMTTFAASTVAACVLSVPAHAGNVTYNEAAYSTQSMAQGDASYPISITAVSPQLPATGKPKLTPYEKMICQENPGVQVQFLVKEMSHTYTDPTSLEPVTVPYDFSSWIDLDPPATCITGPTQHTAVSAIIHTDYAMPGMYTAKLVAKGPNGIGWGEGAGVHITFNVIEPTATDTTPPVVHIVEPALESGVPQRFVLGNRIPLDFNAIDMESEVTAWTASLSPGPLNISGLLSETLIADGIEASGYILSAVPGGAQTIQAIGLYSLGVTATSEGGTSDPATRNFSVNYNISPIGPDFDQPSLVWRKSANNQGKCDKSPQGTMQVKFAARAVQPADTGTMDYSEEAFVDDESVIVEILDTANTLLLERSYGTDNSSAVAITGNTGDLVGNYFTKVNLCNAPNGSYTVNIYFDDHSGDEYLQYSKQFTLQN